MRSMPTVWKRWASGVAFAGRCCIPGVCRVAVPAAAVVADECIADHVVPRNHIRRPLNIRVVRQNARVDNGHHDGSASGRGIPGFRKIDAARGQSGAGPVGKVMPLFRVARIVGGFVGDAQDVVGLGIFNIRPDRKLANELQGAVQELSP